MPGLTWAEGKIELNCHVPYWEVVIIPKLKMKKEHDNHDIY